MKHIILALLIVNALNEIKAQEKIWNLTVDTSTLQIKSAPFNSIVVLDSRIDTSKIGTAQTGLLNKLVQVRFNEPAAIAIQKYIHALIQNAQTETGKLIINLKKLTTYEKTLAFNERGYINLGLDAYLQKNDMECLKIFSIDTIYEVKAFDVTEAVQSKLPKIIDSVIYQISHSNASATNEEKLFSVANLRSGTGAHWALYPVNTNTFYGKGVYKNFDDFKNNKVDSINYSFTSKNNKNFKVFERSGGSASDKKITKEIWGLNTGDKIYIRMNNVFVPLEKQNNTFFFTLLIQHFPEQSIPEGPNIGMTGMTKSSMVHYMSRLSEFYLDMDNGNVIEYRIIRQ